MLLKRDSLWIPVVLLVILVGCWSELDLYAPSFPQMMHYFSTTEQVMQWTLSINFLGFFGASLLCGPLADAFGRRRVIICGSLIFVIGSLFCVLAPTISWMLLGRFIQGLGVSAPVTVCMAVIADIYQGERQVRLLSRMNSAISITMALAPIVGVYLSDSLGWRSNFAAILVLALIGTILVSFLVPETLEKKLRPSFSAVSLVRGYWILLKNRHFMTAVAGLCLSITPYFILIGILPLLFMEQMGVSINNYAFYQGSIVGLYSLSSLTLPSLLSGFSVTKVFSYSSVLSLGALALALVVSMTVADMPWLITAIIWIYIVGLVMPPTMMFASAMDMYPELRACASSLIQSMRMLFMALGTALAGMLYNGSFMPIAALMFFCLLLSLPMTLAFMRKQSKSSQSFNHDAIVMH